MDISRRWTIAITLLGATALIPAAAANAQSKGVTTKTEGVLKVCLYEDIPPIAALGTDGSWTGWDVDFLSGFADSVDLKFEPVPFNYFDGIWKQPGEGVCDITGSGLTYTPERVEATPRAVWSDAYFTAERSFIVRAGEEDSLTGVGDLANKTVIMWPGSAGETDLNRRIEKDSVTGVSVRYAEGSLSAIKMVRDGDAFAFGWDLTNTRFLVARHPGLAIAWVHPMMAADGSEKSETYSYVVRKADAGLIEALNAYIAENGATYGWPR